MVEKFSPYASEAEDESDESADKTNAELEKAEEINERDFSALLGGQESLFDKMMGRTQEQDVPDVDVEAAEEALAENEDGETSQGSDDGEKPKMYDAFSGVEIKPQDYDHEEEDTEDQQDAEPDDPAEQAAQQAAEAEEQRRALEATEAEDDDEEDEDDEDEKDEEQDSAADEQTPEDGNVEAAEEPEEPAGQEGAAVEEEPENDQEAGSSEAENDAADQAEEDQADEEEAQQPDPEAAEEASGEEPPEELPEDEPEQIETAEAEETPENDEPKDTAEQDTPQSEADQQERESEDPAEEADPADTAAEEEAVEAAYEHAEIEEMMEDEGPEDPEPPDNNQNTRNLAGEPDPNDPNNQFDTLAARRAAQENMHHRPDGLTALIGLGLLGERYFRRKGDKKLGREIDKLQKQTENTQEGQGDKISGVELQQQMQAMGLEELRKAQEANEKLNDEQTNELDNLEAKVQKIEPNQNEQTAEELEAEEEKKKKRLSQSISGETFEETNDESTTEGRERRAGLRLETATEEAPEIIAARNIENQTQKIEQNNLVNSELGFEQKVESQNQVNIQDNTQRDPRELASISEILAERDLFKSRTKDDDVRLPPVNAPQVSTNIEDEKYRSSIEAGIVVGLVIIALAAIFFLFR